MVVGFFDEPVHICWLHAVCCNRFVEQWESTKQHLPAITGIVCSTIALLIFGASNFLIPAMIAITISLILERKWLEGGVKDE